MKLRHRGRRWVGSLLAGILFGTTAAGQILPPGASPTPAPQATRAATPTEAELEARRAALAEEIGAARARLESLADSDVHAAGAVGPELDLLARIDRVYTRQLETLRRQRQLAEAESELELKLAAGPSGPISDPPPYPLALADAVAAALRGQEARRKKIETAMQAAREDMDAAERRLEERETARRFAKEALEKAEGSPEAAERARALRLAELDSRLAGARLELARLQLANAEADLALQQESEKFAARTLEWIEGNLTLDPGQLQEPVARLEKREFDLKRELDTAQLELASAERRLDTVQQRVESSATPDAALLAELEARRLDRAAAQRRVALLTEQIDRLDSLRALVERRYAALSGTARRADLRDWKLETERELAEMDRQRRLAEARLAELRNDLGAARESLTAAPPPSARWLGEQAEALATLVQLYEQDLASLTERESSARRTLDALRTRTGQASLKERLSDLRESVARVWDQELFAAEDRPITVGKIATAVLLFVLGVVFARLFSRALGRLLMRRFAIEQGAAAAFQSLTFYLFLLFFFLFALRTVNIPLTAFTVLGGALAIGIGFGSQNIMNNFISGLILMAERPIKVGDIVEIQGLQGRIEHIGPRSTRVRRFDNIHIIVPNSQFLEQNVVNWTLSDDVIRTQVNVGVAYGSPTVDVQRLMLEVIRNHEYILKNPAPEVFFMDFGDSSLVFGAYFWLRVRSPGDRRRVESDVRYRIDDIFRQNDITIAFPQRDVHFDTAAPIPVRLLDARVEQGSTE